LAGDRSAIEALAARRSDPTLGHGHEEKRGPDGIRNFWREFNQLNIDGIPTGIVEKNL